MATLSDVLDDNLLRELAGDRAFSRGVDYFDRGLVSALAQHDQHITAEVSGTETYQVHLWLQGGDLRFSCTCPIGDEGDFCKHCVAVALSWIAEPPPYHADGDAPAKSGTTMADVRRYLAGQERDTLVRMILDQGMKDSRWREQLLMKAASQQVGGPDVSTFRRVLRRSIATGDFIDYAAAGGYADSVQAAIDGLEELLAAGNASDVVELSEEAIDLLEDAINNVDDSDGHLSPILDQVQDLHHRACAVARPDPRALAERLFDRELKSGYGFFYGTIETYADILGEEGREIYRQLVDAEWEKLPELSQPNRHNFDYRRMQLSRMKEALVAATGDLEALVAVIAKDLSQTSQYLKIAQLYEQARQIEPAIAWAERGMAAFKDLHFPGRLADFLMGCYEQQGRFDDAVALAWDAFSRSPSLSLYQKLQQQANKAQAWPQWRDRALAQLRQSPPQARQSPYPFAAMGQSLLVEIFLWEGDLDQAWQAAQAGGCSQRLWMRLADLRAIDHPEDALAVYQPAIEPLINQTSNEAYRQAIDLLIKVKALMTQLNRPADFDRMVADLSTTYKRKRNFIKFLLQAGLG